MYKFDVKKVKDEVINWTRDWVNNSGNEQTKVIIGISGGKDSSTVLAILCNAIGKERVVAVLMPNGEQKDINDSIRICEHFGVTYVVIDISKGYSPMTDEITKKLKALPTAASSSNTPARMRMLTLYDIAGRLGNCRVVNTCNESEDFAWGNYSTLYGDSAGDFAPLQHLTVTEVIALAKELGVPIDLAEKVPSDGMCGSSDEEKLSGLYGIKNWTYKEFDKYIRGQETAFTEEDIKSLNKGAKVGEFKRKIISMPKYNSNLPNVFEN